MIHGQRPQKPAYQISVDGADKTGIFQGRLIELTLTDVRGFEADQLDITLDDSDGQLEIPKTGAVIQLKLGRKGALVDKGQYTVDEVEHSGPPDRLTLRARSADFRAELKAKQKKAWHEKTLGDIITTLAKAHDLTPAISQELANIAIAHIDQTDESDAHFMTRLGQQYDAVATIKNGRLLFIRAGGGQTASGVALTPLTIRRSETDIHRYRVSDKQGKYHGVKARWLDRDAAKAFTVLAGKDGTVKTLTKTYPTQTEAGNAAQAEWQRLNRSGSGMSITLATGNAALIPETPVTLTGYKKQINAQAWIAARITHRLGNGLTTALELEPRNQL